MSDKVDFEEFFKKFGDLHFEHDGGFFSNGFTVEELAAAIEARIIAKLEADWGKQFGGENVSDTSGN